MPKVRKLKELKKHTLFMLEGEVSCRVMYVEWQRRGLTGFSFVGKDAPMGRFEIDSSRRVIEVEEWHAMANTENGNEGWA